MTAHIDYNLLLHAYYLCHYLAVIDLAWHSNTLYLQYMKLQLKGKIVDK